MPRGDGIVTCTHQLSLDSIQHDHPHLGHVELVAHDQATLNGFMEGMGEALGGEGLILDPELLNKTGQLSGEGGRWVCCWNGC